MLELEVETSTGIDTSGFKQLVWSYDPNSIAANSPATGRVWPNTRLSAPA